MKKFFKIVGYSAAFLLFLLIVLAGFTQSKLFKDRLRIFIASAITTSTNASLDLGTIRGNFFTGFTIDSLNLRIGGREFVSTGKISVDYDLLSVPRKTIVIHRLTVQQPHVALERGDDSVWNIDKLGEPSTSSQQAAPFDWKIQIDNLELVDGRLALKDSLSLSSPAHGSILPRQVEYHDFALDRIDLACGGSYSEKNAHLTIKKFSFHSDRPQFSLRNLTGEFFVNPKGTQVQSLIVQTSRSNLKLAAALWGVNIFDGVDLEELQHKQTQLMLVADNIDLNELKSFIHPIDFLNGSAYIDLNVQGEFGNLTINRLQFQTYNTSVKLSGSLQNLHRPNDLFINASIRDSRITPGDAHRLLPPLDIPEFQNSKTLPLECEFVGKPTEFTARILSRDESGDLQAEATLNLQNPELKYQCSFAADNFPLRRYLAGSAIPASLTARGRIEGSGTSLRTMTSTLSAQLDSITFPSLTLSGSQIDVEVRNKHLHTTARLMSQDSKAVVDLVGDFTDPRRSAYNIEAEVTNADLSKLLNRQNSRSKLSFHVSAGVSGSTMDDVTGVLKVSFGPSSFQTYEFADQEFALSVDQQNPEAKEVILTSPIADLTLKGVFSLPDVMDRVEREIRSLEQAFQEHGLLAMKAPTPPDTDPGHTNASFDVQLSGTVKNLNPLSIFLGETPFNGRGTVGGNLVSQNGVVTAACSLSIGELYVGSIEKGFLVENSTLMFETAARTTPRTNHSRPLSFEFRSSIQNAIVNKHSFDNSTVTISYRETGGGIAIRSTVDSLFSVTSHGSMQASDQTYTLSLDTLSFLFGALQWMNDSDVVATIGPAGIDLSQCILRRENERLTLNGTVGVNGDVVAALQLQKFDLAGMGFYTGMQELKEGQTLTGLLDVQVNLKGTLANPVFDVSSNCQDLTYRGSAIGTLASSLKYENQVLTTDVTVERKNGEALQRPQLMLQGAVPVNLGFVGVERRFPDKPMLLSLTANGFELAVLDPLLASYDNITGTLSCNVRIEGTPSEPSYSGLISFSGVRFVFVPNNLTYLLSGDLEAAGDKINLVNIQILNDPKDRSDGLATIGGSLTIRNFTVESFDLNARGQLLLMKESTKRSLSSMYGTLFAEIGPDGLQYKGSFQQSYLRGTIYVKNANLVFPPTRENSLSSTENTLHYIVVDDTSARDLTKQRISRQFFGDRSDGEAEAAVENTPQRHRRTIWDGMVYDVEIQTQGTTEIRMVFNQATGEELFAGLEGRVTLQRGEEGPSITGEIAVSDRSYYNFFKRFSANGTMKFVGQPDNPELNIIAKYEGTRRPPQIQGQVQETKDTTQTVVVTLNITGTRYEPKLDMAMTVNGEAKTGDVQSDAIPFILTGKFRDDLTSREKSDILTTIGSSAGSSILYGLPSQMLSGVLSDFLKNEFSFIRAAEINYSGGNLQESADLRLSGEVGKAYWRFGGRIFNDIGNANVSFQLSMGEVLSAPKLQNLFIELERKVEGSEYADLKKLTNTARIFWKFSF